MGDAYHTKSPCWESLKFTILWGMYKETLPLKPQISKIQRGSDPDGGKG